MPNSPSVTKVKPYPFPGQLKDARGSFAGQIVRLTAQGLMIEVSGSSVQPGEKVEVSFVTPIQNGAVALAGVVVKIYNQLASVSGGGAAASASSASGPATPPATTSMPSSILLIEVHYASVLPEAMNRIAMFLEATGQAKRG